MQNTRLTTLTNLAGDRILQLINNPWRRVSILLLAFLGGFFGGSAITSTTGQLAILDVPAAGITLLVTEVISRFVYSQKRIVRGGVAARRTFFWDVLNSLKMGVIFGLFLEAFKLNS
ncbi:DUF565 domain-containing protein [Spirulina sp. CS-785/01]|uniref:DUF565 domain-containing protein n=1 Tax=Spirulina sp. CS-785/01 TaxID=3021716 RepID=UPI00232D802D|nr:DUF565 domain-containing protein [Spirulina sp. CS-785/01]MDB9312841.1 DUF565 domain-containing protein [Spirulina sp. CS-785/01]